MKNNYSSIQNINKTAATVKQFFIAIVLVVSASFNYAFAAGIGITAPALTVTGCAFPTPYSNLNNIVISETSPGDISTFGSLIITAPANFEFMINTGAVGSTGSDITSATMVVSASTITVTLGGTTASSMDVITISGLKVRGVTGASGATNITRTGGTAIIANDVNGTTHAIFASVLNTVDAGYFSGPDQTICYGGDPAAFIEAVASSGIGLLSSEWKYSTDLYAGTLASTTNYDAPPGLNNTTTYVRVTTSIYNGVTCTDSSNFRLVNVMPSLTGGPLSLNQTICNGATPSQLTGPVGTGGDGSYTYLWQQSIVNATSGFTVATNTNIAVNYDPPALSNTTWYRRKVSSAGCTSNDTTAIEMTVLLPIVTNPASFTTCSASPMNIGLTANMPSTFSWTLGENPDGIAGGSDSNGPSINQTLTNPSNSTTFSLQYNVTATSILGTCSGNSSAIFINVNPQPLANAGSNSTICSDSSVIIGGAPTATAGNGPYTYSWSPPSGLDSPTLSNPNANPTISTTYSVTVTDSLGCAASISTMTVTVNAAPNVNAGADVSICIGNNTTLYAIGGTTYLWSNGSSADSITVNPTVNTTYNVIGTTNGCSYSDTVLVTVNLIPAVNAGSDTTICAGQMATLTATGAASYLWSTGSQGDIITDSPATTAIYFVKGTLNGCFMNDTVQVTVNSLPAVNGGLDTIICAGQSIILSATGNGFPYSWNNGIIDSVSFNPTTTTTYVVTGTLNGCSNSDSVLVTVNSLPLISISASAPICEGDNATLTASGGITFAWSTGASTNSITETPDSTTTYTVIVTDGNNCSNMAAATITVNPAPIANAGINHTICISDTASLSGTGGISFLWTDGSVNYTTAAIIVTPVTSTVYSLTVTDNLGCTDSDTVMVTVTPSKDIFGNVSYSLGDVTNGTVVLYKYVQFQTRLDTVQVKPLNSTGDYVFNNINHGDYLVKVFVNPSVYPTLINTYYGDDFLWNGDSVRVIIHTCNVNDTSNITMVELDSAEVGPGLIIGQIKEGAGFGRVETDPIPGVDVKLGKNPGGIIATTNTSSSGTYIFSGVAYGNYTIYVDIPGLGRDSSYTFTVDSTNNQFLNQNYIADSNSVYLNPTSTVGISNPKTIFENQFSIYPNPVKGNTTIEYTILQMTDSKTVLEVTSVLGVKISSLVNAMQQTGTYKYNFNPQNYQLNSGVYFITLTIDGNTSTKRIVVME